MRNLICLCAATAITASAYAGDCGRWTGNRHHRVTSYPTVVYTNVVSHPVVVSHSANVVHSAPAASTTTTPSSDIVDTAVSAGTFNTLVAAVKAAGLVETLKSEGPFTVFAPTDEAFAKLPEGTIANLLKPENKDKLVSILTYHVVSGKVLASDAVKLSSAGTVNGQAVPISVANGEVTIGGAKVVATDILTTNGVIHVIDSVMLP